MASDTKQAATQQVTSIFGKPKVRQLPSMVFEIVCYPNRMLTTLEMLNEELAFRQRIIPNPGKDIRSPEVRQTERRAPEINAGALAEEFFQTRTPEQALSFLNTSGRFRLLRDESDFLESVVTWREFQLWQELVKIILVENHLHLGEFESPTREMFVWGPGTDGRIGRLLPKDLRSLILNVPKSTFEWLKGAPFEVMFSSEPDPKDPMRRPKAAMGVITNTVIDAILASVFVDTLSGIHFELCAFPDCPNVYEVTSNHARSYCSHSCAHKANMRRRRKEAKDKRAKGKRPRK